MPLDRPDGRSYPPQSSPLMKTDDKLLKAKFFASESDGRQTINKHTITRTRDNQLTFPSSIFSENLIQQAYKRTTRHIISPAAAVFTSPT